MAEATNGHLLPSIRNSVGLRTYLSTVRLREGNVYVIEQVECLGVSTFNN